MKFEIGKEYHLNIKNVRSYSMDNCENGNRVVLKSFDEDEPQSVWVDVTRNDGSICENFLVDMEDLK